jgi:hypothetical protein
MRLELLPAALAHCMEPAGLARPASSFLLLAQKKGTKEEGLNAIYLADVATDPRRLLRGQRTLSCRSSVELPELSQTELLVRARADLHPPNPLAGRSAQIGIEALCFGCFHFGPQMKATAGRAHRRALTQ